MSIFKTRGIILKIKKSIDKEIFYHIFSYDFWKIICKKKLEKKEKTIDIWYLINFEIVSKEYKEINKIRNIKILFEQNFENKSFLIIENFLTLLNLVFNKLENWNPFYEIFDLMDIIVREKDLKIEKIILAKLKIINLLWELKLENDDIVLNKILKFIDNNHFKNIVKLKWFDNDLLEKLEKLMK